MPNMFVAMATGIPSRCEWKCSSWMEIRSDICRVIGVSRPREGWRFLLCRSGQCAHACRSRVRSAALTRQQKWMEQISKGRLLVVDDGFYRWNHADDQIQRGLKYSSRNQ